MLLEKSWCRDRAGSGLQGWRTVLLGFGVALSAAACTTDGASVSHTLGLGAPTVAFDSIDGPPVELFRKLVDDLNAQARARHVAVVAQGAPASYRVRGYLAAHMDRGRNFVTWVWNVYDSDRRMALRITGDEQAGRRGGDAWAAVDDELLQRIARLSMDQLASYLAAPGASPGEPPAKSEPPATGGVAEGSDGGNRTGPGSSAVALAAARP
jgi:hypothetical protein